MFWRKNWTPSFDEVRDAAYTIAKERSISANDTDVRAAASLYHLGRVSKSGNLGGSEVVAREAFALMFNQPSHITVYRKWIEAVLAQREAVTADEHSVLYLEFLKSEPRDEESVRNRIVYWARLIQGHRAELPRSLAFFEEHFPHVDLDNLPAERLILPSNELYKRTKPPMVES
jgi:hypothetical protein